MRVYVERTTDAANCFTALLVAAHQSDTAPEVLFVDGGALLPRDRFLLVAQARSRTQAAALLAPLLRGTPLETLAGPEAGLEERLLRALIREQRDIARLDPLGPAPIIECVLRSRAECDALQRLAWGVALGAPPPNLHAAEEAMP